MDLNENKNFLDYKNSFLQYSEIKSLLVIPGESSKILPLISIMIPTFRRPDLLKEAITSSLTQKTKINYEIVVVDNEQDMFWTKQVDDLILSFDAPNLKLYRNDKNIGMFGNWNRCIELAKSEWITILNDDDLLLPNYIDSIMDGRVGNSMLAVKINEFGEREKIHPVMHFTKKIYYILKRGIDIIKGTRKVSLADVLHASPVPASLGVLINKECAISLGGYNPDHWPSSDYVFNARYWSIYGIYILPKICAKYRWGVNESLKIDTLNGWLAKDFILRKSLIKKFVNSKRSNLLVKVCKLQATVNAYLYQRDLNAKFNANDAIRSMGLRAINIYSLRLYAKSMPCIWRLLLIGSKCGIGKK